MYPVHPEKAKVLKERMRTLGIREDDLDEQFVRSSGPGGQNVNKVATCVVLTHRPSGITVRCQASRAQGLNRFLARKRLVEKLDERIRGRASDRQRAIEKIRRQKRKRSKRAKEKMLAAKHHRAEIKAQRQSPRADVET